MPPRNSQIRPPYERLNAVARHVLTIECPESRVDLFLWEHSLRVARIARLLRHIPELANLELDDSVLTAAALFHDAGWADQFRTGQVKREQILTRPTTDMQRELGAVLLQENLASILPAKAVRSAADAVRECNRRNTEMLEARVLSEAENLDEVGLLYFLRLFRQYQFEGRPLGDLVQSWQRQQEYQYWEMRVNDGFRFETTKSLARERLKNVNLLMDTLASDHGVLDLERVLNTPTREATGT